MLKRQLAFLVVLLILAVSLPITAMAATVNSLLGTNFEASFCENGKMFITKDDFIILENTPYMKDKSLMLPLSKLESLADKEISIDGYLTEEKNGEVFVEHNILKETNYSYELFSNGVIAIYSGKKLKDSTDSILLKMQGIYVVPDGKSLPRSKLTHVRTPAEINELTQEHSNLYGDVAPVNMFFYGGSFRFTETLKFNPAYFSESKKGLGLYPYGDGEAVLTGATALDTSKMECANDPMILARLKSEARGEVGVIDLASHGVTDFGTNQRQFTKVFIDDDEMVLSRWPNKDWANIASVIDGTTFTVGENDCKRWATAEDMVCYGYFNVDYAYSCYPVLSFDPVNKIIKLNTTSSSLMNASRVGARYYAANLLEEIDMPGEYYVDKKAYKLYLFPPHNLKNSKLEIISSGCDIIELTNMRNVTIKGLGFEKTRGRAIYVNDNISHLTIEDCTFKYIQAENAIEIGRSAAGNNQYVKVIGNYAYGNAGQLVDAYLGSMKDYTPSYSEISNNYCVSSRREAPVSLTDGYQIAIGAAVNGTSASVDVLVQNNLIVDCDAQGAIYPNGPFNKVYYNEIVNQSPTLNDGGSIYIGRTTIFYGTEIAYNYTHDFNREHSYVGYYNDDAYSGARWHHNVARDVNYGFLLGSGMDMDVSYNLMIDCSKQSATGSRMNWDQTLYGPDGTMIKAIETKANEVSNFYELFPVLKGAVDRTPPMAPWNSVVFGNVGVSTGGTTFGYNPELTEYGADTYIRNGEEIDISELNDTPAGNPHFDYSDDYFVDPKNGNYNVKPDSELAKAVPELLEIDITKTGLSEEYVDMIKVPEEFLPRYPRNKSVGVKPKNLTFAWDTVVGASFYRLVVSENSDLSNPVIDEKIRENNCNNCYITDELDLNTVYYWKVYAEGVTRQKPFLVESKGGPYVFKTASKNDLDKSGLNDAITALGELITSMGSDEYEFSPEYITKANELIKKAEEVKTTSIIQNVVDEMEEEIYTFILLSPYYVKISFTNVDELFNKDINWNISVDNGSVTHNGDEMVFDSGDKAANFITDYVYPNKVLCFKAKFEEFDGGYQAFYFKNNANSTGYLFVAKENIFEYQTQNKLLVELPNDIVKAGEYHNYEIGAVNLPNGVLRFVRVDGNVLYANLDRSTNAVYEGERFFIHTNANSDISMMKYDESEIPETTTLIDEIYKSFNKPYSKAHLEALLTGAADCLELSDTLYSLVNKASLAELIFDKLPDIEIKDRDITKYHDTVMENAVIVGYNQGLTDYLYKDKWIDLYPDITKFETIDSNGVYLYDFMVNKLTKANRQAISQMTTGKDLKNLDELRREYARSIFTISINACAPTFAVETNYMFEIITKENADYMGVDLSNYFALSKDEKTHVHELIGKPGTSMERSFEQLIKEIEAAISEIK